MSITVTDTNTSVTVTETNQTVTVMQGVIGTVAAVSGGPQGAAGPGVALGGASGSVLVKASGTNYDTTWVSQAEFTWRESGPFFTYTAGAVTRIDYDSGNYKTFTYALGKVSRIDYVRGAKTIRKDFVYNQDGTLNQIVETEI